MQKVRCKEREEIINRSQTVLGESGGGARRVMSPPPYHPIYEKNKYTYFLLAVNFSFGLGNPSHWSRFNFSMDEVL
jgi:hypothetical protein